MYPKKELAQLVIATCSQYSIDTVVISPGSRNAPLTIGFTNHPGVKTMSIVDERCAAFFALGIAQQRQKAVAILCSSGSALLNYYPAIAEAFYSNIPLVIISADRPKHLIDIGDGQTIRQEGVFKNHVLVSANLVEGNDQLAQNATLLSNALEIAQSKKGPVHVNVPFDEPLYQTVKELNTVVTGIVENNYPEDAFAHGKKGESALPVVLKNTWELATKKMILVGVHSPDSVLQEVLHKFEDDPSVIILTETTSNIASNKTINSIDQLIFPLTGVEMEELKPSVLITFGGMIVSKKIKQFLRKFCPEHHWHIDSLKAMDTFHCLTAFINEEAVNGLEALSIIGRVKSNYQERWLNLREKRRARHEAYLSNIPFSDLKAFELLLHKVPSNTHVQLSNSSIVRYAQLFDLDDSLKVFCNRGTSGIDGSTSTAIGAAVAVECQTLCITGDLSFFYDSNALWNKYIPNNFRIVIINNSGGGIFRFIPGPKSTNALDFFETPHQLTAAQLSEMYGFNYCGVHSLMEVEKCLIDFFDDSEKPKIMEIFTDKEVNEKVLKEYFNSLK